MKPSLIVLVFFLTLGLASASDDKQPELRFSEVGLRLLLAPPGGKRVLESISLTFTNTGTRVGMFRLPSPLVADNSSPSPFARFPPWLGLLVKELKSGREEQFAFTTFGKLRGPAKLVSLSKGRSTKLNYRLTSFYRWGPCNPDSYGSFKDYFKPGGVELEVRAVLFHEADDSMVVSNPQMLRCSFPEWLFKASTNGDAALGKPKANRGRDTQPEVTPGRTGDSRP